MKTILITGGASGFGKGIAMHYLKKGDRVIAIGSSPENGQAFLSDAASIGAEPRVSFIQADLSLIVESRRVCDEVKMRFDSLDAVVFSASKHSKEYKETSEGYELTFALDYLSRFILSYGLKDLLEKSEHPVIINMCGTGMKGEVNWSDLQHKADFESQKVMMHGSRLNDLSGVAFVGNDKVGKVRYVLYNPWAVQTPGMMEMFSSPMMKLMYRIIGKPIEKAVLLIAELLDSPPAQALSAYRERKMLDTSLPMYCRENAKRLYDITVQMLEDVTTATN